MPFEQGGKPVEIHRLKGRLQKPDGTILIVQGVREVYDIFEENAKAKENAEIDGKLVFIGKKLRDLDLEASFKWYVLEAHGREK